MSIRVCAAVFLVAMKARRRKVQILVLLPRKAQMKTRSKKTKVIEELRHSAEMQLIRTSFAGEP